MTDFDVSQNLPQVKRIVIISNKHGIYELPHKLLKQLRLRTLGNLTKISKLDRIIAWCSVLLSKLKFCQYYQKILEKWKLNFSYKVLFQRKTTVCLKYFGWDCLCKQYFPSSLWSDPFKFDLFNNFGNSKDFNKVLIKN